MSPKVVLSFDIGIRNLAWCLMSRTDASGSQVNTDILGWDNYDLLAGDSVASVQSTKAGQKCCACSAKGGYTTRGGMYCVRHCPSDRPALRDLSGNVVRGLPNAKILKSLLQAKGVETIPKTKDGLTKELSRHFALPIAKVKVKKATETEWAVLHDRLRQFVQERIVLFRQATEICLENQPVLKNPTMKTVQILLYATLREQLQPNPPVIRLVHAKTKVGGKTKGDAGYKDRKQGSEDRALSVLHTKTITRAHHWLAHLQKYTKKNDLTDALCMCLDFLETQ
jgi:hypothetical protein